MDRRAFLKLSGLAIIAVVSGCGGGGGGSTTSTSKQIKVTISSGPTKTVNVKTNTSILDCIKQVFSLDIGSSQTTINGITGNWKYIVNGVEPNIYAGEYPVTTDSSIELQLI